MVINKYFNTESNVILVGKIAKAGGTSLLASLYQASEEANVLAVSISFESSSSSGDDILRLDGMLKMLSLFRMRSVLREEVVILLDEVTWLPERDKLLLVDLITRWSEEDNLKFICTGGGYALLEMLGSLEESDYFSLSPYNGVEFVLTNDRWGTLTRKGERFGLPRLPNF